MDTKHSLSNNHMRGFSLVELMTVIAIIGTVTALAMPVYNEYITNAKANALWTEAAEAKLAVESAFLKSSTPITSLSVAANAAQYTTARSNFVSCITINNGVVSVVGDSTKLNSKAIWVSFVPNISNGTLDWQCYYSADAAAYLAENCQTNGACAAAGSFGAAAGVSALEYFSYSTNPPAGADYNTQCALSPATFGSCQQCYNFVNTTTTQRYMSYTLLSAAPNVFSQQCMQETAVASNCSAPATPSC
jgi:type IV pilus assembly protein PilA